MKSKFPTDASIRKLKDLRQLELFSVTWRDARSIGGWDSLDNYRTKTIYDCTTVGYLAKNTAKEIQLVQTISESGGVTDAIIIPKSWVKRVKRLA